MLEKMSVFFDSRLDGYEEHQLTCIEGARSFYPFTASRLPLEPCANVLDLGCGTGLELDRLKARHGITDSDFYHYDTPLTVEHETQALQEAGFPAVEILRHWGTTYTLKASK